MVESFRDFIHSPPDRSPVRTLSPAELDQQANSLGRPTQNRGLSFHSNLRNRSAGFAAVFGTGPVALTVPGVRRQPIRDTLRGVRGYLKRAPLVRVQRTIGVNPSCNPKCILFLPPAASKRNGASIWPGLLV